MLPSICTVGKHIIGQANMAKERSKRHVTECCHGAHTVPPTQELAVAFKAACLLYHAFCKTVAFKAACHLYHAFYRREAAISLFKTFSFSVLQRPGHAAAAAAAHAVRRGRARTQPPVHAAHHPPHPHPGRLLRGQRAQGVGQRVVCFSAPQGPWVSGLCYPPHHQGPWVSGLLHPPHHQGASSHVFSQGGLRRAPLVAQPHLWPRACP